MAEVFVLENPAIRLAVEPQRGARVTSLIDKASGREWLVGPADPAASTDDHYDLAAAAGWDECFPTVLPAGPGETSWRRPLRDHGELWGRPWQVEEANSTRLTTRFATSEFTFTRMLELAGAAVQCSYEVVTAGRRAFPFLWAQQALLAVTPADRILMPGVKTVDAGLLTLGGVERPPQTYAWPGPGGVLKMPFDRVYPPEKRFAAKFYARMTDMPFIAVGSDAGWLDFTWDARELPYAGLWLNFGGWPAERPLYHLAIEPTTAPTDRIDEAATASHPFILTSERPFVWTVTLNLRRR